MKHFLTLFISLSLTVFTRQGYIAAQQVDSLKKLPRAHWMRSRTLDVKHIALDLQFDWKKKHAYGIASVTFSPLKTTDRITLDAGMLTINSITVSNGVALKFEYDNSDKNDNLQIQLDRSYSPSQDVTIAINYHINETDPNNLWGSYGKGLRFFGPTFTDPRKRKQIWSAGIPESNRYWFPGYDGPDDFRTTELKATVDKELIVVSNGVLVNARQNGDGTKTFHWKMDKPYANHQTSVVVGEYVDLSQNFNGVEIHNYSYPDEVEAVKASTVRLTDMMKFFSEKIGVKYPYPIYNQVFVQEFPWGGGHNMNSSTLSDNMIDDEGTHADFLYLWDGVEGNDLAAQWFGNLLTPKSWEHAWLNKSFATYFSGLYSEYKNGLDEYQLWVRSFNQNTYLGDWYGGNRHPIVTNQLDPITMTSDNYSAIHGAEVLHMLRKQLGEEQWWKSIAHYVKSYSYNSVTTEDFLTSIKTATGQDMQWFFDQWIYGIGHPIFEVTKKYDPAGKKLLLTLRQTQTKDSTTLYPQAKYFKGWMDIALDERIERVWVESKRENIFSLTSTSEPKLVNVDVGGAWVKEMKFEKPLNELLYQFKNDKDVTGRSSAMTQLVTIAKTESTSVDDKQKIVDAFYLVVSGNSYWRFRMNALGQLRGILKQPYDAKTLTLVKSIIEKESSWLKSSALFFMGTTNDPTYAPIYIKALSDKSDRVIGAAALALAKTNTPGVFDILMKLKDKPSWKNQSLMTAMNAMKIVNDPRTVEVALKALRDNPPQPRWTLANNSWDYRVVAAETLVAFGKGGEGFPIVLERFKKSMEENDVNDIFNNVMLIAILGDSKGLELFDSLKTRFKEDANAMVAVEQYEAQLKEAAKAPEKQIGNK
jgi:aminopeptidase N